MKIIKIDNFTLYLLLILFLTGYINIGLIIFFIVFIHEMGHVLIAKLFKYRILKVTIYPFGGITVLEKDLNTPTNIELLIALGGIIAQLIIIILINIIDINMYWKTLIIKYNFSIMIFNLIPIIPLDGSAILGSIINKMCSFKKTYFIQIIISILCIIIYMIVNYWLALNNYLIIILFIYKTYEKVKNYKYIHNRFLLERYLKNYNFKHLNTNKGNLDDLKIDTKHYFKEGNNIVCEKEKLAELFDK